MMSSLIIKMTALSRRMQLFVMMLGALATCCITTSHGADQNEPSDIGERVGGYSAGTGLAALITDLNQSSAALGPGKAAVSNALNQVNPETRLDGLMQDPSCARDATYLFQVLTATSCAVIKYFSVKYPETQYGYALLGLYILKSIASGIGTYLEHSAGKPILNDLNALNEGTGERLSLAAMHTSIGNTDNERLGTVAREVLRYIDSEELTIQAGDRSIVRRLRALVDDGERSCCHGVGSWILSGAKILAPLIGITSGVIALIGDMDEAEFATNTVSGGLDAFADHMTLTCRAGEIVRQYVKLCMIACFCERLLGGGYTGA
ncbi:MAG: hypothetical protein LBJ69_04030 [Holosporales bacterium]|nr:hypothetical protein [Holosporales bacterium]